MQGFCCSMKPHFGILIMSHAAVTMQSRLIISYDTTMLCAPVETTSLYYVNNL